jgi:hypothetical protein
MLSAWEEFPSSFWWILTGRKAAKAMTLSMNKLIIMSNCVCETLGVSMRAADDRHAPTFRRLKR